MILKRTLDLICSLLGLIGLFPFLIVIACWIKLDSPGSVFFRQERVGLNGKSFWIHKFRTMTVAAEQKGKLTVGEDVRITNAGKILRKYKVDELPQLIDVIQGTMSLVGPRPEVRDFIDYYSEDDRKIILSVRPGITDLASIELIDENALLAKCKDPYTTYKDKVLPMKRDYYVDYVRRQSIMLDVKIILLTIFKILKS